MLCFNIPRKTAAMIQVWVCVVLIVASVFASFAPIITLDITDKNTADSIESFLGDLNLSAENLEIPEKIDVTPMKLVGSISLIAKSISLASSENPDEKELEELQTMMEGEEGKNTMLTVAAIAATVVNVFSDDSNKESGFIGKIFNMMIVVVSLVYMLIFTLIAPIVYIILALTALIPALTKLSDPAAVSGKIGKKLPGMISFPMVFILFQCIIPTMHYGSGAMMLWVLALVCVLANVAISRLRMYTPGDVKYLNVVQGVSVVSMIGTLIFFFNIINTGVFHTFITGHWGDATAMAAVAAVSKQEVVSKGYILDAILILVAVLLVLTSVDYLKACLQRISCTVKKGGDCHIACAIAMVVSCVLPMVVMNSQNYYEDMTNLNAEPAGSFLDGMTADGKSALTMALVGAIIAVVAEIALIVLKKVLCGDVTAESMTAVVSGNAKTPDEKVAEAKAVLEAAAATVAAAAAEENTADKQ